MTAMSDLILRDNEDVLERMLDHPFIQLVANDRLSDEAYHRYLVYEGAFVETAISIFAYGTAKAPDIDSKRWLIGVQKALAREQVPYFERSFTDLGLGSDIPIPTAVEAFEQGMLKIAQKGDFSEIVTAMFAAEWMYFTWCSRVASCVITNPHIRQWVDLHADPAFEAQARWLKETVDRVSVPADRAKLSALFGHVTELEIAFHHAPLMAQEETADA